MHQLVRMYGRHEARENAVLFPALGAIVSKHEFDHLVRSSRRRHALFGETDLRKIGGRGRVDKSLSIYELAQFTPKWPDHVKKQLFKLSAHRQDEGDRRTDWRFCYKL
jgi:hypothetical protein